MRRKGFQPPSPLEIYDQESLPEKFRLTLYGKGKTSLQTSHGQLYVNRGGVYGRDRIVFSVDASSSERFLYHDVITEFIKLRDQLMNEESDQTIDIDTQEKNALLERIILKIVLWLRSTEYGARNFEKFSVLKTQAFQGACLGDSGSPITVSIDGREMLLGPLSSTLSSVKFSQSILDIIQADTDIESMDLTQKLSFLLSSNKQIGCGDMILFPSAVLFSQGYKSYFRSLTAPVIALLRHHQIGVIECEMGTWN